MIESTAGRPALKRQIALIAALALLFAHLPALAAPAVRVTLRPAITLGLAPHNSTAELSAAVKTGDGSAAPAVVWSGKGAAATVDANGRLTAQKPGAATIYATAGGATAKCVVTVRRLPVKALTLNKKKLTLFSNRAGFQLTSKPTPANADNPNVTWSSSRPSVARVDKLTGFVTPLKPGTAVVQCRAADGTQKKSTCTVVVKPVKPSGLTLSAASLEVTVGAAASLTATVSPADATDQRVSWCSTNPAIASVKGGVVTGHKFGKATITAKTRTGSIRARCTVSVGYFDTTFRALVIGQAAYTGGNQRLPGCLKDARMVKSMLLGSDFGGGKNVKVTLLEDRTTAEIHDALKQMATWGVDSDDVTYFYYSGHGDEFGSLVGTDGGAVRVSTVREYLDKLPGTVVVMIDSCYSGWFIRSKSTGGAKTSVDPDVVTNRIVSAFSSAGSDSSLAAKTSLTSSKEALGKYRILTSSSSDEESYIIFSNNSIDVPSLFTFHLAKGGGVQITDWDVASVAMSADANRNRIVTLNELYLYTKARVNSAVARVNKTLPKRQRIKQSVRVWPAGSSFPVVQRTP